MKSGPSRKEGKGGEKAGPSRTTTIETDDSKTTYRQRKPRKKSERAHEIKHYGTAKLITLKKERLPKKGRREWEKPEGIQTGLIPGRSAGLRVQGGPKGTKPPLRPVRNMGNFNFS